MRVGKGSEHLKYLQGQPSPLTPLLGKLYPRHRRGHQKPCVPDGSGLWSQVTGPGQDAQDAPPGSMSFVAGFTCVVGTRAPMTRSQRLEKKGGQGTTGSDGRVAAESPAGRSESSAARGPAAGSRAAADSLTSRRLPSAFPLG